MTEKLEDYARVCERCGESFRSKSRRSRICYDCCQNKKRSMAVVGEK